VTITSRDPIPIRLIGNPPQRSGTLHAAEPTSELA
jgi:hypothetical protein